MPKMPVSAYVIGFLFVLLYCSFFFFSSKIENKLFAFKTAKKLGIFFMRLAKTAISGVRRLRDVFFVRLIEEGIIEGLLLEGTAKLFSAIGSNPLRKLDGNINWYMLVSILIITAFLVFL